MKQLKLTIFASLLLALSACNLDYYPSDGLTQGAIESNPNAALYVTIGNYSILKDILEFRNALSTGNTYIRHYFQATEFKGDNISISASTTDQLYDCMRYRQTPETTPTSYLWYAAYKTIISATTVVEMIEDGTSVNGDQLKGENLFLRGLTSFHLLTLFSKPYSYGPNNLGIVLRTSSTFTETKRATVEESFEQIIADLEKAASLMTIDKGPAYANKAAAYGLLSRVYLYKGDYQKAIEAADACLAIKPAAANLEQGDAYISMFANATTSKETLFAVACTDEDDRGQSSIASMYISDGIGWGEIYASQPYRTLLNQNPEDLRHGFIKPKYTGDGTLPTVNNGTAMFNYFTETADTGGEKQMLSKLVTVYYHNGTYRTAQNGGGNAVTLGTYKPGSLSLPGTLYVDGATQTGFLIPNIEDDRSTGYPRYFVTKFSYQNGNPMLSSPVMIRLAEVVLNRAEAKFHLGQSPNSDLDIIKTRAGIPTTSGTVTLEDILNERRLELSFEGHRAFDLFRNKLSLDRRYPGAHNSEIIDPNSKFFIYYIPSIEIETSGITQN